MILLSKAKFIAASLMCLNLLSQSTVMANQSPTNLFPILSRSIWSNGVCNSDELRFRSCFVSLNFLTKYASGLHQDIEIKDGHIHLVPSQTGSSDNEVEAVKERNLLWEKATRTFLLAKANARIVNFENRFQDFSEKIPAIFQAYRVYLTTFGDGHSDFYPISSLQRAGEPYEAPKSAVRAGISGKGTKKGYYLAKILKTGSAYKSGLRDRDIVIEIDGQSFTGMDPEEFSDLINLGAPGTIANIKVLRGLEEKTFFLTRESVLPSSYDKMIIETAHGKVGYIGLYDFTDDEVSSDMKSFLSRNDDKVIGWVIDVRDNAGGSLRMAYKSAAGFLDDGQVVYWADTETQSQSGVSGPRITLPKKASDVRRTRKPIVVLVNSATASAAEVLVAALRDNDIALVVGERTFGKGIGQTGTQDFTKFTQPGFELLSETELIKMGEEFMYYRTNTILAGPSGVSHHVRGIIPDFVTQEGLRLREIDMNPQTVPMQGPDYVPTRKRLELVNNVNTCVGELHATNSSEDTDLELASQILKCWSSIQN